MEYLLDEFWDQSFMRRGKIFGIQGGDPWLQIIIFEKDQDTYMPSFNMDEFKQVHVISLSSMPTQIPPAMKMVLEQVQAKESESATKAKVVPNVRFSFRFDEKSPLTQLKHLDELMGFKTCDHDVWGGHDELEFLKSVYDKKQICGTIGDVHFNFSVPYTKHNCEWHNDLMSYYPSCYPTQELDKFYSREFRPYFGCYKVREECADASKIVYYYDDIDETKIEYGHLHAEGDESESESDEEELRSDIDESESDADDAEADVVCHSPKRARREM